MQDFPPASNERHLHELVTVRVLKSFCVKGKPMEIGATVRIERHDALSLQALKKAEILQ